LGAETLAARELIVAAEPVGIAGAEGAGTEIGALLIPNAPLPAVGAAGAAEPPTLLRLDADATQIGVAGNMRAGAGVLGRGARPLAGDADPVGADLARRAGVAAASTVFACLPDVRLARAVAVAVGAIRRALTAVVDAVGAGAARRTVATAVTDLAASGRPFASPGAQRGRRECARDESAQDATAVRMISQRSHDSVEDLRVHDTPRFV
jgi:hypothetical protein